MRVSSLSQLTAYSKMTPDALAPGFFMVRRPNRQWDLQLTPSAKLIACVFIVLQFLIEFAYFLGFSQKGGVSYES
jgi:hypothetical protein